MVSSLLSLMFCGCGHQRLPKKPKLPKVALVDALPCLLGRTQASRRGKSQEMPVDGLTKAPIDLYNSLLLAGDRAKLRGEHTLEMKKPMHRSDRGSGFHSAQRHSRLVKTEALDAEQLATF